MDEIKWHVISHFKDIYSGPSELDRTSESIYTLAQGLMHGKHTLKLIADSSQPPKIKAIRIYKPPMNK